MLTNIGFIDIAANLTDPVFQGVYNGKQQHEPDLDHVLDRAWKNKVQKIVIKSTNRENSIAALNLAKTHDNLYCTIGCSPANVLDFKNDADNHYYTLRGMGEKELTKVVAIGEVGLDYDINHLVDKTTQIRYFEMQIELARILKLPLLVRCRNSYDDTIKVMRKHSDYMFGAVVHGFDGDVDEARRLMNLDFYIGLNGCSFNTKEKREVVKELPVHRLMLGTDSPSCPITYGEYFPSMYTKTVFPTNKKQNWSPDKMVKGRNEPCSVIQVLETAAAVRNENPDTIASIARRNSKALFFDRDRVMDHYF